MPDRPFSSISEEEERTARSSTRVVTTLVAILIVATAAGYFLFGRQLPHFGTSITVGNYREMPDAQASQAIANAGLVVRITKRPSDNVEVNHVIEQNPSPGTPVDPNSVVELFVSNGLPLIGLRDVTNFTLSDAQRDLASDKFNVKVERRHAPQPKDTVLEQSPKAGASVRQGSYVRLIVSDGPALALLPSLLGMTVDQAKAVAKKDGFTLDSTQRVASGQYPSGVIAAQDVNPGTSVDRAANMTVRVTVSTGSPPANIGNGGNGVVPSVQGRQYADAVNALRSAGFNPAVVYNTQAAGNGTIIAQEPQANSDLPQGASVTITLSVSGEVPDTQGLTIDQARATLEADGYVFGDVHYTSIEGAGGKVVRTQPEAGTSLQPGSRVTLVVNGTQQ